MNLSKEELEAWKAHPVTEIIHKYLRDFARSIRESWSQGDNWTEEAKYCVQAYEDLADIDLESIKSFYEETDGDEV